MKYFDKAGAEERKEEILGLELSLKEHIKKTLIAERIPYYPEEFKKLIFTPTEYENQNLYKYTDFAIDNTHVYPMPEGAMKALRWRYVSLMRPLEYTVGQVRNLTPPELWDFDGDFPKIDRDKLDAYVNSCYTSELPDWVKDVEKALSAYCDILNKHGICLQHYITIKGKPHLKKLHDRFKA